MCISEMPERLCLFATISIRINRLRCINFSPDEARRIAEKIEFHYTPKHGSWLNMAEIELSVLSRQCLCRRIPDQATLRHEIQMWQTRRMSKLRL